MTAFIYVGIAILNHKSYTKPTSNLSLNSNVFLGHPVDYATRGDLGCLNFYSAELVAAFPHI